MKSFVKGTRLSSLRVLVLVRVKYLLFSLRAWTDSSCLDPELVRRTKVSDPTKSDEGIVTDVILSVTMSMIGPSRDRPDTFV